MPETQNENLAAAIREIRTLAVEGTEPTVQYVRVSDGKDDTLDIPVAFLAQPNGALQATPLLNVLKEGTEFARQLRLADADGPDRRVGTAQHQALSSFIDHANRFKAPHSAVWANPAQRSLVSVLDYHPEGSSSPARWGKHRGVYSCPLSEAWLAWGSGKTLELDQDGFAALLDSRDRELASGTLPSGAPAPAPSSLITLAANLEVYSNASAKRERDPNTGRVKISYSEEKGVSGTVLPPPAFLIEIPVFQDGQPEPLEVRLRVTVDGGHAKFAVQVHSAGDVLRDAFDRLCGSVTAGTGLPLFFGTPE